MCQQFHLPQLKTNEDRQFTQTESILSLLLNVRFLSLLYVSLWFNRNDVCSYVSTKERNLMNTEKLSRKWFSSSLPMTFRPFKTQSPKQLLRSKRSNAPAKKLKKRPLVKSIRLFSFPFSRNLSSQLLARRIEENKARQQAILARFAAKQKAFMDTAKENTDTTSDDSSVPSTPLEDQASPQQTDRLCVLCKVRTDIFFACASTEKRML